MSRYFFRLVQGADQIRDPEGHDLSSAGEIGALVLADARSILSDEARRGRLDLGERIEVQDATNAVVHRLVFADAVEMLS